MLRGRDVETAQIRALIEDAVRGTARTLVIRGSPGVGKSALIADVTTLIADTTIVRVVGVEAEHHLPHAGVVAAVRPLLPFADAASPPTQRLVRHLLGHAHPVGAVQPFEVAVALLDLVCVAAVDRPIVLVIDDAQWVDPQSLMSLLFVARRLVNDRVAVLIATRLARHTDPSTRDLPVLELGGLDVADGAALVMDVRPDAARTAAEDLSRRCGGNPLALEEAAWRLTDQQARGNEPITDDITYGGDTRRGFDDMFLRLPADTQLALAIAAVEPGGDLALVLAAVTGAGLDRSALDAARADELIRIGALTIEFRHPLVRAAASHARPDLVTQAHLALAAALEHSPDRQRRALHLGAATVAPDADVGTMITTAADAALASGDIHMAARLYSRACELVPSPVPSELLLKAGTAATLAGLPGGPAALEQARARAGGGVRYAADALLARHAAWTGDTERAQALAARAALDAPPVVVADLYATAASSAVMDLNGEAVRENSLRAMDASADLDASERLHADITLLAASLLVHGQHPRREHDIAAFLAALDLDLAGPLAYGLIVSGRVDDADRVLAVAVPAARERASLPALAWLLVSRAWSQRARGKIQAAAASVSESLELFASTGNGLGTRIASALATVLDADAGDAGMGPRAAGDQEPPPPRMDFALGLQTFADARVLDAAGRQDDAMVLWERLLRELRARGICRSTYIPAVPWALMSCLQSRRDDRARELLTELEDDAAGTAARSVRGNLEACVIACGNSAQRATGELVADGADPVLFAHALVIAGDRHPHALERVRMVRQGIDAFDAMGLDRPADRARRLIGAEVRGGHRRHEGLTARERRVAELAATGMSTRDVARALFLSPKTVESNLTRVYRKLGLRNRAELAHVWPSVGG